MQFDALIFASDTDGIDKVEFEGFQVEDGI